MIDIIRASSKIISSRLQKNVNIIICKEIYNREISRIYRLQDQQGDSYIVKTLKNQAYQKSFINDYLGLKMNNAYGNHNNLMCPELFGLSDDMKMIVMSEIKGENLQNIIFKGDYSYSKEVNIKKVESLADMHLLHLDHRPRFKEYMKQVGLKTTFKSDEFFKGAFDQLKTNVKKMEIKWSVELNKDLSILNAFFNPEINDLFSFTHGDLADNNIYMSNNNIKFIDFEKCAYRPMFTDLYFNRMTVGYEIPEDVLIELENEYRVKISKSFKEILNDDFYKNQLVCSGAFYTLKFLAKGGFFQYSPFDPYKRKCLKTLRTFSKLSRSTNVLPNLGGLVSKIKAKLERGLGKRVNY